MTAQQAKHVWEAALGQLQLQVTRPSYETWLKDTVGVAYRDREFLVGTPSAFISEMLEQRMYSLISMAVEKVTHGPADVRFQVVPSGSGVRVDWPPMPQSPVAEPVGARAAVPTNVPTNGHPRGQMPLFRKLSLNPAYTFDNFIVGKSNELAHAAAMAVAQRPGAIYNPLVIYSAVGLGKTHLLHAIGHTIESASLSLIYATTEEFTNEYIRAIREGRTQEFRDRYRSADVLLLDDIQFLIGKEQTQEGFFHTFNALHMANRQIVITSDRPVTSLSLLEDRVRSRLAGGLVVDIQPPDLETRMAILAAKAQRMHWDIAADVIQFLGERIHKNVRQLEGNLNRVVAYARLTGSPITLDMVGQGIGDINGTDQRSPPSDGLVLHHVAAYFSIPIEDLKGRKRDRKTALARQVAMYLLREESGLGPSAIGRILGGKDHTTVIHGCSRIASRMDVDPHLRRDTINIREAVVSSQVE